MKQFVPVADDYPVDRLQWPGSLVPYQCGLPCRRGLASAALRPTQRATMGLVGKVIWSPDSMCNRSALPPDNSST